MARTPRLGRGGRRFKSCFPDMKNKGQKICPNIFKTGYPLFNSRFPVTFSISYFYKVASL